MAPTGWWGRSGRRAWDASSLLAVGAFLLVIRAPLGFHLLGALSVLVLALQRPRVLRLNPLTAFLGVSVMTAAVGTALRPSVDGYFLMALEMLVFAWAVLGSGDALTNARKVYAGVFGALLTHLVISIFEVVTGIKVLPLRNPDANTAGRISTDPFAVASLFANFNDYSVAMAMLSTFLIAQLAFSSGKRRAVRWAMGAALAVIVFLLVQIGSRGAQGAFALASAAALVMIVRFRRPRLLSAPVVLVLLAAVGAVFYAVWNSPYLQDNSTNTRGVIIERALVLIRADQTSMLFGYGSYARWEAIAASAYPGALMSPHNVFLESVIGFGVVATALFALMLVWVAVRGFVLNRVEMSRLAVVGVATTLVLPVYGAVPSGFLDYGYVLLFPVLACASFTGKRAAAQPSAGA